MVNRRGFLQALGAGAAGMMWTPPLAHQVAKTAKNPEATQALPIYPYLQDVRSDSAIVMWTTLQSGTGTIQYSLDGYDFLHSQADRRLFSVAETGFREPFFQHRAVLEGLIPDSDCYYNAWLDGKTVMSNELIRFRSPGDGPFKFLAFGDSGMGTEAQAKVAQLIGQESTTLVVHVGDVSQISGTYEDYQNYHFRYYWEMLRRAPLYPSPGNHDYLTNNAAPYLSLHSLPASNVPEEDRGRYYSFDWGNVHFIALDSNACLSRAATGTKSGKMLEWLEKDLQQSKKFWRIVYFHHPPYATGINENDPLTILVRQYVVPLLDRYEVELVLGGHEHSYQRSQPIRNGIAVAQGKGTQYITTGGGGAYLYPIYNSPLLAVRHSVHHYVRAEVNGSRITLEAIRDNGSRIDNIVIAPMPSISDAYLLKPEATGFPSSFQLDDLLSISGWHFADEDNAAASLPLPNRLSNIAVELSGKRLSLLAVSSTQLVALLPSDIQGAATLRVTTPNGTAEAEVMIVRKSRRRIH